MVDATKKGGTRINNPRRFDPSGNEKHIGLIGHKAGVVKLLSSVRGRLITSNFLTIEGKENVPKAESFITFLSEISGVEPLTS